MKNIFILALIALLAVSCSPRKGAKTSNIATDSTKVNQITLKVVGMIADTSEVNIENGIKTIPGIVDVNATYTDSTVLVSYIRDSTNIDAIRKIITQKGFKIKSANKTPIHFPVTEDKSAKRK